MRFLKADKLFDGRSFRADDSVLVLDDNNLLQDIVSGNELDPAGIEIEQGIITPGFINTHCHLELSHLRGMIPEQTGLPAFARQVVSLRNTISREERSSAMQQADRDMWNAGLVAVGDISNTDESFEEKIKSRLYYHTFIELIGLNPANASPVFEKGKELLKKLHSTRLGGSLAPHAPYSTSTALIKQIADSNKQQKQSLSIHNQESEEETRFFHGQPNGFEELYRSLGLDISWFHPPGTSSLKYYSGSLADTPSILVHNTFTGREDVAATRHKDIYWCFCPAANLYIENSLPDFSVFAESTDQLCIGTDSLASNTHLDVVREANILLERSAVFSLETILKALTFNGAKALGISENFGQLKTGKNPGLNLVTYNHSKLKFVKKIA